jgi:hypothetical protein
MRWAGLAVGAVVAAYLVVVAAAMVLGVSVPYAPWPTGGAHHSNGAVQNGALHQVGNPVTPSPGTDARPSAGSGKSAAPGASPSPSGPSPTSVPTTAAPTAVPIAIPTAAPTATATAAATKTNGNSASAPGHTKSPNPHKPA